MLRAAILALFIACPAYGDGARKEQLAVANARCAVIYAQLAGFTNKPENKQSYKTNLEHHAKLGVTLAGVDVFRREFDHASTKLRSDVNSLATRDAKLRLLMDEIDKCGGVAGSSLRTVESLRKGN